jgi:hypothetical protein
METAVIAPVLLLQISIPALCGGVFSLGRQIAAPLLKRRILFSKRSSSFSQKGGEG